MPNRFHYAALFLLCILAATAIRAESSLRLSPDRFDFGLSPQNGTLTCRVWVVNNGIDSVRVGEIKAGCGCLIVRADSAGIAPGDSLQLSCYWQTRGSAGQQAVSAYLYTDGQNRPQELVLVGNVVTDIDSAASVIWRPRRVALGGKAAGSANPGAQNLMITNRTETDLGVAIIAQGSELELEVPELVSPGQPTRFRVGVADALKGTEFESSFTLEFSGNDGEPLRVSIPVVKGDYGFRPRFTTSK